MSLLQGIDSTGAFNILSSWNIQIVSQSVTKEASTFKNRHETRMRFVITFSDSVRQVLVKRTYGLKEFVSDFGASLAIMGLGLLFVQIWQTLVPRFRPASVIDPRVIIKEEHRESMLAGATFLETTKAMHDEKAKENVENVEMSVV
jgi:hypothetical protein